MKKILLIENDLDLAELYTEVLSSRYKVEVAGDGRRGLELARKSDPDLILMEILLPEINGFEVLKAIKKDSATKDIFVVILTNLASKHVEEDKKLALLLGADDYLVKAQNQPREIMEKISTYLE